MNNRPKTPPVNIKEMEKKEGEEHKQGEITYLRKDEGGGGGRGGGVTKSKINLTQLVLAVGLSILVFVLISNFWLTPKRDAVILLENQKLLETQQAGLEESLLTESGRIDNVISSYATKSELAGFVSDSELASLSSLITGIGDQVSSIESLVDDQGDRIVVLEEAINGTAPMVGGGSYCYLTKMSNGFGLTAVSSTTGYFLAQVTLILDTPSVLDYEVGTGRYFIENLGYVNDEWKTVSITFYTGEFKLKVGEVEDDLEIPLSLSYEVEGIRYRAYVEILPSAVTTTNGGNVI